MDSNKIMIDAIRQEPALYGNNQSLEERNRAWKKLSAKLNMQEQYLKIRWHSLVQRYQNEVDFKYTHQMQFLKRKTVTNIQEGNWPEFVITEEDLHDQQQNGDEFEFVELDEVDTVTKQIKEEHYQEKENHSDNKTTTNQDKQIKIVKALRIPHINQEKEKILIKVIQSVDTLNEKGETTNNRPIKIINSKSTLESATKKIERPLESKTTELNVESNKGQKQEEPMTVDTTSRDNNEYKKEEPRREEPKKIELLPSRCEDDIFGELVSAMLKRMDEAKKKNVKKEIMNLLLT